MGQGFSAFLATIKLLLLIDFFEHNFDSTPLDTILPIKMSSPISCATSITKKQLQQYTLAFKVEVAKQAHMERNTYSTTKILSLPITNVVEWLKNKNKICIVASDKKAQSKRVSGRITTLGLHTERAFVHFVCEHIDKCEKVSTNMLKIKLHKLDPTLFVAPG